MLEFGPHQFRRESRMSPTKKAWCQKLSKKGDPLPSLKLTAKAPNNRPGPKRKAIFQSSGFQELMCWSQGVCNWSPNSAAKTISERAWLAAPNDFYTDPVKED